MYFMIALGSLRQHFRPILIPKSASCTLGETFTPLFSSRECSRTLTGDIISLFRFKKANQHPEPHAVYDTTNQNVSITRENVSKFHRFPRVIAHFLIGRLK